MIVYDSSRRAPLVYAPRGLGLEARDIQPLRVHGAQCVTIIDETHGQRRPFFIKRAVRLQ